MLSCQVEFPVSLSGFYCTMPC